MMWQECGRNMAGKAQFCFTATTVVVSSLLSSLWQWKSVELTFKSRLTCSPAESTHGHGNSGMVPATWNLLSPPKPPRETEFMEIIHTISEQIGPEGWEKRTMWHHESKT